MTEVARRIDAHQHFWDLSTGGYDWPRAVEGPIFRSFAPADLEPDLRAAGIDATVLVQTTDTLDDTDAMIAAAAANPWIAAIVAWLPLSDVAAAAAALEVRAGQGPIRGVRHLVHREADPDWLVRPDLAPGLAMMAVSGLSFDVVAVFPKQLCHVPTVADRHPDLTLVIDHLAKPPIRGDGWIEWRRQLRDAAARPNVVAKISGLDTAAGPGWTADELRPSIEAALEAFGADRLLFGTDWPVCRQVSTYGQVVTATERVLAGLTVTERAAVFGGTAQRVYRLS